MLFDANRIRIRFHSIHISTNLILLHVQTKLFNDGVIGFGVHRFARLAHRYTKVYYYQNSYVGRFSHTYYPDDKPYGMHCILVFVHVLFLFLSFFSCMYVNKMFPYLNSHPTIYFYNILFIQCVNFGLFGYVGRCEPKGFKCKNTGC